MLESTDTDSISSELDERLDSLFGEDENDKSSLESSDGSPIEELKGLMLTIDWEISDDTLIAFHNEVENLKRLFAGDPYIPLLLKMLSSLTDYLKAKKGTAHPDTLNVMESVFQALEKVLDSKDLSSEQKKKILELEVGKFKNFKSELMASPAMLQDRTVGDGEMERPDDDPHPVEESYEAWDEKEDAASTRSDTGREDVVSPQELADSMGVLKDYLKAEFASLQKEMQEIKEELKGFRNELSDMREQINAVSEKVQEAAALSITREELSAMEDKLQEAISSSLTPISKEQETVDPAEVDLTPETESTSDEQGSGPDFDMEGAEHPGEILLEETDLEAKFTMFEKEITGPDLMVDAYSHELDPLSHYFRFELGGEKYIVDEQYVIKACKVRSKTLKKVKKNGVVGMMDFKSSFASIKKDLEPSWEGLSAKELKAARFTLIPDDALEGLEQTLGGGILFLGNGEKQAALLTDELACKEINDKPDKMLPSSGEPYIQSIMVKEVDKEETFKIIDVDRLL